MHTWHVTQRMSSHIYIFIDFQAVCTRPHILLKIHLPQNHHQQYEVQARHCCSLRVDATAAPSLRKISASYHLFISSASTIIAADSKQKIEYSKHTRPQHSLLYHGTTAQSCSHLFQELLLLFFSVARVPTVDAIGLSQRIATQSIFLGR